MFNTREEKKLAQFFNEMHQLTGKTKFRFDEILRAVVELKPDISDWKGMFDYFIEKGWITHKIESNEYELEEVFDLRTEEEKELDILCKGLQVIEDVCNKVLSVKEATGTSTVEKVEFVVKRYRELLGVTSGENYDN